MIIFKPAAGNSLLRYLCKLGSQSLLFLYLFNVFFIYENPQMGDRLLSILPNNWSRKYFAYLSN